MPRKAQGPLVEASCPYPRRIGCEKETLFRTTRKRHAGAGGLNTISVASNGQLVLVSLVSIPVRRFSADKKASSSTACTILRNRYKEIKEDHSSHHDKFIERRTQDAGFLIRKSRSSRGRGGFVSGIKLGGCILAR